MVTTMLTICSKHAHVLIDSGVTLSFVSYAFVVHMNRSLEPLLDALLVHTPVGDSVIIEHVYRDCELVVDNVVLLVDL